MDPVAALKIVGYIAQALALGEKLIPVIDKVKDLYQAWQDPDRPDVTLEVFDQELAALKERSRQIQDTSNDPK